jgi:hypothetical protein
MANVSMSLPLMASAEQVWKIIGGFNAIPDWHPAVEKSELEVGGEIRKLTLVGGGEITERLDQHDDASRTYTYTITSSPLPVANYTATITVKEEGGNCSVEWSSEFEPSGASENQAVETIQGVYQAGFDNLKKRFSG